MDVAADADGRRRGDHVARTLHVHAIERRVRRDVLADDADEVDHRVAAGHALLERLPRQHVSLDALDRLDAPEIGLRAPTHQAPHDVALRAQRLDDRAADEPGRAGDEHPMQRTHLDPTIPVLRA